jgi:LysM repeat protein
MKRIGIGLAVCVFAGVTSWSLPGQTLARSPAAASDDKLDALSKKIDEQNKKIDLLSQEILKLELQISNMRPGVMVGEGAPSATAASPAASETPRSPNGSSHIVARGETLTSIAKMYNVTAGELQRFNHIENDRKLQIGQTIMIPGTASPGPSPSPSAAAD